jgi:iron complex transport system permease protein
LADVAFAVPFMLFGWVLLFLSKPYLTSLSLGEKTASTLGFNPERQKILVIRGVAFCVGAAVSVSGSIGFVGLVVPHLIRPLVRFEPGRLLWLSALCGAVLLLLADSFVQVISPDKELKLGVITALVGGPFFLYLIVKTRHTLQ